MQKNRGVGSPGQQGMVTSSGGGTLTVGLEKEKSREGDKTVCFYYVSVFASAVRKSVMRLDKWVSSYEPLKIS